MQLQIKLNSGVSRKALRGAIIFTAVLQLVHTIGQTCTRGFLNPQDRNSYVQSQLVPLLGRHERSYGSEQWIFPNLKFSCHAMLSRWIFKGIGSPESACRVHFTTWRLSIDVQDLSPVYEQRSTTNGNTARIGVANDSESVIAYELARPVRVQPGDVIGVEMPMCTLLDTYHNVLSLNVSETKSRFSYGYRRFGNSGTSFNLESPSVYQERGYQPLINVDMDAQNEPAAVTITLTLATEEEEISEPSTMSESSGGEANSTGTGDESTTQTVSMVQRQDDSLIIIIEASVASGGFIAILVFVSACISVILIRRHRKAHAHYYSQPTRRRYCNSVELEQNGSNFNETSLQDNAAYNRGQPTNRNDEQESNNNKWPNQAHLSWTETYEEVDLASEQYETMPDNSAYSECGSISSNYNSLETFNSSSAYMQAHDKREELVLTNAGLNEHEVVWLKQKGTRSMENEASRWRESTSEMYDVVDRKSEAYESIDYRDARWMKMSKNMAYARSTQVEREAQIEHSLQERNDYEHQYEHIQ